MSQRLDLHALLIELLGTHNVYFQPPPTIQMEYPCIIYRRDFSYTEFANNSPYCRSKRYLVTVVDRNPDSLIPDKVSKLQSCIFDRYYTADGLNHDVYKLYFDRALISVIPEEPNWELTNVIIPNVEGVFYRHEETGQIVSGTFYIGTVLATFSANSNDGYVLNPAHARVWSYTGET